MCNNCRFELNSYTENRKKKTYIKEILGILNTNFYSALADLPGFTRSSLGPGHSSKMNTTIVAHMGLFFRRRGSTYKYYTF